MSEYPKSYEEAVNHAMLYEVGGFWKLDAPGVREGLIDTPEQRKAVGYVNDPLDQGGETKFGVAKNANPDLDIHSLDWDATMRVYYRRYWLAANCDDLAEFAPRLAVLHFDIAVNHGVGRAGKFLQKAVGAAVDGDVGPGTLALVKTAVAAGEIAACNDVCDQRVAFYHAIVANKPEQVRFLKGWLRRASELRAFVTDPTRSFE
jgi:lysozyme family protein